MGLLNLGLGGGVTKPTETTGEFNKLQKCANQHVDEDLHCNDTFCNSFASQYRGQTEFFV